MATPRNLHQSWIAAETSSGPLSQRMDSGAPRLARASSRASTTSSPVIERPRRRARFSRVNSSHMESALIGRPSEVASKMKSIAQTWLGCSARSRSAGTVLLPNRRRLGAHG